MNNVLKPELVWIEGRCYRTNNFTDNISTFQEHDLYENEDSFQEEENDEVDDFEVTMIDNSRFTTSFHVSKHYIGAIIGKKGATKMRIERDTKTDIKIPKQGQPGDVVIFGSSAANVKAARRRVNIIIISSRMKQKYTHFISIPMNTVGIQEHFGKFKENVLKECPDRGVEESLFIKSHKLHLTIGVMCLMDNEERLIASKLLTDAKEKVVMPILQGNLPLRLRLKGISYMNDDPKEIHVLYGLIQEEDWNCSGLLQNVADNLVQLFYKAGYMDKRGDNVKLHVTLMNSRYRDQASVVDDANNPNSIKPKRVSFDGSNILNKFSDFDFGVTELNDIHLSLMPRASQQSATDSYYQSTCIISLNT